MTAESIASTTVTTGPAPVQPVVYSVIVNGAVVTDWILDMEISQVWGQHEVVSLRIELRRSANMQGYIPWPVNAPVQVIWGRRPVAFNNWYGYVNHYRLSTADTGTGNVQYTYYLVGVSKPMNTDVARVWGNVTPTYIAKVIAQKYGLRCVVTSTDWLLHSEIQANESDFSFLNRIAGKTGFRFWVGNGTLYFIDPAVYLSSSGGQGVPEFTMNKRVEYQDTVRNFEIIKGDNLPGATLAQRSIHGMDPRTGKPFQVLADNPSGSLVSHVNTDRVATSYSEGQQIMRAWQDLSQFWIGARAELFGNSSLYPGKLVYLAGKAFSDHNSGYWLVTAARHVLKQSGTTVVTADKYMVQVELVRNESAAVPRVNGMTKLNPEFCACFLDKSVGQWKSTNLSVVYDGVLR